MPDVQVSQSIESIGTGRKGWIAHPFRTREGREFRVSVGVIRGSRPGPVMAQLAGQHGMEHLGPIMLRDLFEEIDPGKVAGTLLICPAANPLALELDYEVYPEGQDLAKLNDYHFSNSRPGYCVYGFGRNPEIGQFNMNRMWPNGGGGKSGVIGQVVRWLWKTMIEPADMVIDHHALRAGKALIFCEDPAIPWAPFLGFETIYSRPMPAKIDPFNHAVLPLQAIAHGKMGLCVEYSQQHGLKEHEREQGRFSVLNLMRAMGMLEGAPEFPRPVWLLRNRFNPPEHLSFSSQNVGHLHFRVDENQPLKKGDVIVEIRKVETHEILETFVAPCDGLMLSRTWRAVNNKPGDELFRFHTSPEFLAGPGKPCAIPKLPTRKA
jgi:predicted deacylase